MWSIAFVLLLLLSLLASVLLKGALMPLCLLLLLISAVVLENAALARRRLQLRLVVLAASLKASIRSCHGNKQQPAASPGHASSGARISSQSRRTGSKGSKTAAGSELSKSDATAPAAAAVPAGAAAAASHCYQAAQVPEGCQSTNWPAMLADLGNLLTTPSCLLSDRVLPVGFSMMGSVQSEFTLGKKLGEGACGVVYAAVHNVSGIAAAVKIVDKGEVKRDGWTAGDLRKEVLAMLMMAGHPNAVQLLAVHETPNLLYVMTELCELGDYLGWMQSAARKLSPQQLLGKFSGVMSALTAAHAMGLVHRDIKPENILVRPLPGYKGRGDVRRVKLMVADWGCSMLLPYAEALVNKSVAGTPQYMAPEMRRALTSRLSPYGAKVDVYATAVVIKQSIQLMGGRRKVSQEVGQLLEAMKDTQVKTRLSALQAAQEMSTLSERPKKLKLSRLLKLACKRFF